MVCNRTKEVGVRVLDEKTREAVAENVRTRRTLLGMSQVDVAKAAGLSEVSVSNIENKTRSYIRPSTMRKLAMALETTVQRLYGVEEGNEGPLVADPLTSPEATRWFSDRAGWEHYAEPAVWLKGIADDGLDGLGERAGRLFAERGRARRDLLQLRREIEQEGAREGHQDRRDWARDLTRSLERHLEREHRRRLKTLNAIEDAMIAQQAEKLPEPEIFEIYDEANASVK